MDIKRTNICIVCGKSTTLQFHHVDEKLKKFNIANAPQMRYSFNTLDEELTKCVLLCKECHEAVHNENFDLTPFLNKE